MCSADVLARRVGDSIGLEVWRDGKLMALQAKTAEPRGRRLGIGQRGLTMGKRARLSSVWD